MIQIFIGFLLMILIICDQLNVNMESPVKIALHLYHNYHFMLIVQGIVFLTGASMVMIFGNLLCRIIAMIFIILFLFLYHIAWDAGHMIHVIRGKNDKKMVRTTNNLTGPDPWEKDYWLTSDLPYDSSYPNSFMDIYNVEKVPTKKRPVFLYAHGGGYVFGDKSNGDPNAMGIAGIIRMIKMLLDQGFVVISTEYVFAPEYCYPAPIKQMDDLLHYLVKHADEYGLDMEKIVFGGGSAGGQIMAQTACLQTNPEYAKEMGISAILDHGEIKAVYLGCSLLDNERFGKTSSFLTNYFFYQMGRAYFHNIGILEGNSEVKQSNIITHVTKDYPASFICDGNAGTFNQQAHDLDERLTELGVMHTALIYDSPDDPKLIHGFDTLEYDIGKMCMEQMTCFVSGQVQLYDSNYNLH